MDPLSTTASIIAVIQLSTEVVQYISTAKGAFKERRRLRDEIQACGDVLQQIRDEYDESEEGVAWSEKIKTLEARDAPLNRLHAILSTLNSKLQSNSAASKALAALKWPFQEKEIDRIVAVFEREKSLLAVALINENRKLMQDIQKCSKEHMRLTRELLGNLGDRMERWNNRLIHHEESGRRSTVLDWLTTVDYTSQQHLSSSSRESETGSWFLDSIEYRNWFQGQSPLLFCPGIPGAGKTILTSAIIDDLLKELDSYDSAGICYIYCDFRHQTEQSLDGLLLSLLRQLSQHSSSLPQSVGDMYDRHQRLGSRPTTNEIFNALQRVITGFSRTFVVVDALDECATSEGTQSKLITTLLELQRNTQARILATSRPIPDITRNFQGFPWLEVRARTEDISKYIEGNIHRLKGFVQRDTELQNEIKNSIVKFADGMFLLAQLHFQSLLGKMSARALRDALSTLARGADAYDTAYSNTMDRVCSQPDGEKKIAIAALMWISFAKRPLSTKELQHALAVEVGATEFPRDNISDISDIVSSQWPLYLYSSLHWGHHAHGLSEDELSQQFLGKPIHVQASGMFILGGSDVWGRTALHLAAHFGLSMVVAKIIHNYDPNQLDEHRMTPMDHAIRMGHQAVVRLLLDKNASLGVRYVDGYTPLPLAASFGQEAIVQLLLERNVEVNLRRGGRTALHCAAGGGREAIVKTLLERNAELSISDRGGLTPIGRAVENGHEAVVKLLLERKPELLLHVCDPCGMTPLHLAVKNGREAIVKLLLCRDAEVDTQDRFGHTPIFDAVCKDLTIFRLLLDKDAIVDTSNNEGFTPLLWAARWGYSRCVEALLDHHATVESRDTGYGRTPLLWAAREGYHTIVQLLYNAKADPQAQDIFGRTALFGATQSGSKDIVMFLLTDDRTDVNARDYWGSTPISVAARYGYQDLFKQLIAMPDVDVTLPDKFGRTPLWWALNQGHTYIAECLIALTHATVAELKKTPAVHKEFGKKAYDICEVCFAMTWGKDHYCNSQSHARLTICGDCRALGAHCLSESHSLVPPSLDRY
ncbi:putative NACHT domain-containing protein [Seiridium cardinale]